MCKYRYTFTYYIILYLRNIMLEKIKNYYYFDWYAFLISENGVSSNTKRKYFLKYIEFYHFDPRPYCPIIYSLYYFFDRDLKLDPGKSKITIYVI